MSELTTTRKKKKNENVDSNGFTTEKKQSKFSAITETAGDYVSDAGRLLEEGVTSAISTVPSMPESLINLLSMGKNFASKQLGLAHPDQKAKHIDIPFLPSFSEAKSFFQSPTQGTAFKAQEGILSQGKQNEIKMGLLEKGIYPNSPEWNNQYADALKTALDMPTSQYETKAGEILSTPAEWFGMGFPFGKTAARISGFAGGVNEALKAIGIDETHALVGSLGLDFALTLAAGVRNPKIINQFNDSVKFSLQKGSIKDAKELMQFAKENNIPLLGVEALAQATGDQSLIKLAKLVSQSGEGKKYFLGLNNRKLVLSEKSEQFVNDFFGAGNLRYLDVTENMVQSIQKARDGLMKKINAHARKNGYKNFDANAHGVQATSDVYDTLIKLSESKKLSKSKSKSYINAANEIKGRNQTALQDLSQGLGKDIKALKHTDPKKAGYLQEIKGYVDTALKQIDGYEQGNKVYQKLFNRLVAPLDAALDIRGKEATMGLLEKVLLGKNDYVSVSSLAKQLNKIDKKLFPEVAQTLFSEVLGKVKISESMGGAIKNAFYGTSNKQKQIESILRGVANAQGKDPNKVIKGFKAFIDTMEATSKYSGGESITAKALQTSEGMGSKLGKINIGTPFAWFDTLVANKNWDQLGQIITSPNSIDIMVRLANTPAYQRNWRLLLSPLAKEGALVEDKEQTQKKYKELQ